MLPPGAGRCWKPIAGAPPSRARGCRRPAWRAGSGRSARRAPSPPSARCQPAAVLRGSAGLEPRWRPGEGRSPPRRGRPEPVPPERACQPSALGAKLVTVLVVLHAMGPARHYQLVWHAALHFRGLRYPRITVGHAALGVIGPNPYRLVAPAAGTNDTAATIPVDQGPPMAMARNGPARRGRRRTSEPICCPVPKYRPAKGGFYRGLSPIPKDRRLTGRSANCRAGSGPTRTPCRSPARWLSGRARGLNQGGGAQVGVRSVTETVPT